MMVKKYIDVIALMDKDGRIKPLMIVWENGVKYSIDRILEIRNAMSDVGGCGVLYRCRIQNQERRLFYERNRWFIESEKG